jgi:hypothetical protein
MAFPISSKKRRSKKRYLRHDAPSKVAIQQHYQITENRFLKGADQERGKRFDLFDAKMELELMHSLQWQNGPYPFVVFQIQARKIPEQYILDRKAESYYVQLRKDFGAAQFCPAECDWIYLGNAIGARVSDTWTVQLCPEAQRKAQGMYQERCSKRLTPNEDPSAK